MKTPFFCAPVSAEAPTGGLMNPLPSVEDAQRARMARGAQALRCTAGGGTGALTRCPMQVQNVSHARPVPHACLAPVAAAAAFG